MSNDDRLRALERAVAVDPGDRAAVSALSAEKRRLDLEFPLVKWEPPHVQWPFGSDIVLVDSDHGPLVIDLPQAGLFFGKLLTVKKVDASPNVVQVGDAALSMQHEAVIVHSDGERWEVASWPCSTLLTVTSTNTAFLRSRK